MVRVYVALLLALAALGSRADGETFTLVDDRFNDGIAGNGTDPAETDIAWFGSDSEVPTVITTDPPMGAGNGNVLSFETGSNNRTLHGYFEGQTLTRANDFIQLSMDYKYNTATSFSQGVRIALVDSKGTIATSGQPASVTYGDEGYGFSLNPGVDATNNEIFRYYADYNQQGTAISASYDRVGVGGFRSTAPGDAVHNLVLTITRLELGDVEVTAVMDGVFSSVTRVAETTTDPLYYFDQVYLRLSGNPNKGPVYLDNVMVTTNAPEPATMSLLLVAGVGLLGRRRGKR